MALIKVDMARCIQSERAGVRPNANSLAWQLATGLSYWWQHMW